MDDAKDYFYRIADFKIKIRFYDCPKNDEHIIPSFRPFRVNEIITDEELLFQLDVDDSLKPYDSRRTEVIGWFDTANGMTCVERLTDNAGYQFTIGNRSGDKCCILQADRDFSFCTCALTGDHIMRNFGIDNALRIVLVSKGCCRDTLLIHASLVRHNGYAYAFIADSGTGKSTHTGLWLQHIEGCDLMNDDNPIIRVVGDDVYIYGTPWSGKTPCYRQTKAKLGAITKIKRARTNSIERLAPADAIASLIHHCSSTVWDKTALNDICNTIIKVIEKTDMYTLNCLPDKEAALLCHQTITK